MTNGAVNPQPVLRGPHVTIRPGGRDDVPQLHAVRSEESVTRVLRQYERGADGRFHDGLLMELLRDDLRT
jgi:hypothetical protein